jgi:hypothetical protein
MTLMSMRKIKALVALLVSTLMAACGQHSTDSSTSSSSETLTIYQDPPTMSALDLGPPGNSPGDAYYFSAPLYSSPGGRMIGEVFGSKTLIELAAQTNPNSEKRATILFFTFAGGQDQIIVLGAADYPPTTAEFDSDQPVMRAILGGTGRYIGARGQLASTRKKDGSYTQVFTLLK